MFKKVLTFVALAGIITAGIVSDRATAQSQADNSLQSALVDCHIAYMAFIKKGDKNGEVLKAMFDKRPDENSKQAFKVVCMAYTVGYENGIRGRV